MLLDMEFMSGLSLITVVQAYGWVGRCIEIAYAVVVVMLICGGVFTFLNWSDLNIKGILIPQKRCILSVFMFVIGLAGLLVADMLCTDVFSKINGYYVPTGKYEVTVNDTVSMDEFYSRYDVIALNDGVYTVRMREDS